MNRSYRPLDAAEIAELQAWAAIEGRSWKMKLQTNSWWRGLPARDRTGCEYVHLYGLRNSHGPSWLMNYRLPK